MHSKWYLTYGWLGHVTWGVTLGGHIHAYLHSCFTGPMCLARRDFPCCGPHTYPHPNKDFAPGFSSPSPWVSGCQDTVAGGMVGLVGRRQQALPALQYNLWVNNKNNYGHTHQKAPDPV